MNLLIPFVCAILFRMGGKGYGDLFVPGWEWSRTWPAWLHNKLWRRVGIGLAVSLMTGNWWYLPGYMIAMWAFCYGESCWLRKIVGSYICWFVFGFVFGVASMNLWNGVFSGVAFLILMSLSNSGIPVNSSKGANDWLVSGKVWKMDHTFVEVGIGFLATAIYIIM